MKQVIVSEHETPQHTPEQMEKDLHAAIRAHYRHMFRVCPYCGWFRHRDYVCDCGVDTGYLEDDEGELIRKDGKAIEVFKVPE